MENHTQQRITVKTTVNAPIEKVWEYWTNPAHITQWYNASADWHAPYAENDLVENGKFKTTMAAKDGSFSFDLTGTYHQIIPHQKITFSLDDGRKVDISFVSDGLTTAITETFEPEETNPLEMQKAGWQAIIDNFKNYTETQ